MGNNLLVVHKTESKTSGEEKNSKSKKRVVSVKISLLFGICFGNQEKPYLDLNTPWDTLLHQHSLPNSDR